MVYSTLYDKGSIIIGDFQYKMLVRYQDNENNYEIVISRFLLTTNVMDTTWGAHGDGVFRMVVSINTTAGFNKETLSSGIWKDTENNLVFGGLIYLPQVSKHGYFLSKITSSTGDLLDTWGDNNSGVVLNQVTGYNLYGMVAELLVQTDDRIITAGTINSGVINKMVVMKHNATGNKNSDFNGNGVKIYTPLDASLGGGVSCQALSFDTYGNYFIGGKSNDGTSVIVSLNSIGGVNNNFSADGEHILHDPADPIKCEISAMLTSPSKNGIYVSANDTNPDTNAQTAVVWRIKYADGDLDNTFNDDGKVEVVIPGKDDVVITTMRMDRELSLYVSGFCRDSQGVIETFIIKMDQDGIYDTSFGINGVFLDNNSTVEESGGYLYVDYATNDIKYSIIYRNDANPDTEVVLLLGSIPYSGNADNLLSYDHIDKQLIPAEQIAKVLQAMALSNSTIISIPASEINNLFISSFDAASGDFTQNSVSLSLSDANNNNNDLIELVQSGLVPDFWNYFIQEVESRIPEGQKSIWDETSDGVNGFTNEKLLNLLRASNGTITLDNINGALDEYIANTSIFTHRIGIPKSQGFVAGDKLGANSGFKITLRINITAATGGTETDVELLEQRTYNLIINLV